MKRSLPPLNGLRAFEAAARHMSFTDAAAELSVTQAAISHQASHHSLETLPYTAWTNTSLPVMY